MKGNTVVQKQKNKELQDEGKIAYMIAWRDRRIKALEEVLGAEREAGQIYAAYIAYLLAACGESVERDRVLKVPKQGIREICGQYSVAAEDAGEHFLIILKHLGEQHGAGSREMADA